MYDSIDMAPIDPGDRLKDLILRTNDAHALLRSCVYDHANHWVYYISCGVSSDNGLSALASLANTFQSGQSANGNFLFRKRARNWTRDAAGNYLSPDAPDYWRWEERMEYYAVALDPRLRTGGAYQADIMSFKGHGAAQLVLIDRTSRLGSTTPEFTLFVQRGWSVDERLQRFARQVNHRLKRTHQALSDDRRTFLWAAPLWRFCYRQGMVQALDSWGTLQGYRVRLDEQRVQQFITQALREPETLDDEQLRLPLPTLPTLDLTEQFFAPTEALVGAGSAELD